MILRPPVRRVLELYCGHAVISEVAGEYGFESITLDIEARFEPTLCIDILDATPELLAEYGPFELIWASPVCTLYSTACFHAGHYDPVKGALTDEAKLSDKRVIHTLYLIEQLNPTFWFLENPRGLLRKMDFMRPYQRVTVTYCRYGCDRMKPTDLWGRFPRSWIPRPTCKNGHSDHIPAPRGSRTSTQGMSSEEAAIIPRELAEDIFKAVLRSNGESWVTLEDFA